MIFITGDCHGNFERFNPSIFPEQKEMTKEDYVIICGDFGGVWHKDEESPEETMVLDWLDSRPFTTLFVCGNHENFDRLYQYPVEDWHGGKVHKIRDSVLHLMRGQVFEIEEKKIFSFGGPAAMISRAECWNRMIRSLKKSMHIKQRILAISYQSLELVEAGITIGGRDGGRPTEFGEA